MCMKILFLREINCLLVKQWRNPLLFLLLGKKERKKKEKEAPT